MTVAWWHQHGACNGTEDDVFFPPKYTISEADAAKKAEEKYCRTCPVRVVCLESAIDNGDHGVWAGTTYELREKLSRKRDRKKCPGCSNLNLVCAAGFSFCTACGLSWKKDKNIDGS